MAPCGIRNKIINFRSPPAFRKASSYNDEYKKGPMARPKKKRNKKGVKQILNVRLW